MPDNDRYIIAAVQQAGEILKTIANMKTPMTVAQIASTEGISPNMAFRHLATLENIGFVQRINDHYRLGMGLALMWARVKSDREETVKQAQGDIAKLNKGE